MFPGLKCFGYYSQPLPPPPLSSDLLLFWSVHNETQMLLIVQKGRLRRGWGGWTRAREERDQSIKPHMQEGQEERKKE